MLTVGIWHSAARSISGSAGCHGVTGDGQGPAAQYLNPPPRDYRLGQFKFTSTPRGSKPRREDLARIIRRGAKGDEHADVSLDGRRRISKR